MKDNSFKFFLKLNIFNDKKRLKMIILVFICQVLFLFIGLFSYSSIMSTLNGTAQQGTYKVNFEEEREISSLNTDKLDEKCDNYYTYLDDELAAAWKPNDPTRGRNIEKSGEMIASENLEYQIGDEAILFDKKFIVVGISHKDFSEIFISDVPTGITTTSLTVINNKLYSSNDKTEFKSLLEEIFAGSTVSEPLSITFSEIYMTNDYFKIIIGILLLSFATIALTIYYTISVRKSNYAVFRLVGMPSKSLYGYTVLESTIMILLQSVIACGIYLIFDFTVNKFIQMNAYESYYRINVLEYFIYISAMWAIYVFINVLSLTSLRLKKLKEVL